MTLLPSSLPKQRQQKQLTLRDKMLALTAHSYEQLQFVYAERPLSFLKIFDPKTKWPAKLKQIFAEIWLGKSGPNVIMKAPRGGGKSRMLGSLGFALWFFKHRSIVDMAGSLAQAKIVYNYFTSVVYSEDCIVATLPKEPMMERTTAVQGNYFNCVPASPKGVRGPHPDVLMADEACEIPDDLLLSALPMVDTSANPLLIITSTFHKVFGLFQDTWDRAEELGFTRYSWDIFDVIKTFDPKIWDDVKLNREIPDLKKLKLMSKGRTGDPDGWVPVENIINAWRSKRSVEWFLTEYMGERPGVSGLVNDPVDVDASAFDPDKHPEYAFKEGAEAVGGIDWGFSSMTAVVGLMKHLDDVKVQTDNKNYIQTPSSVIIEDVVELAKVRKWSKIYADSAGKFENVELQAALDKARVRCKVVEVVFSKDKFGSKDGGVDMLGNYRAHFQRGKIKIPKTDVVALWQHKRYRYMPGSDKPMKKDDHVPDATMCALKHWPLGVARADIKDLRVSETTKPFNAGLMDERF